MERGKRSTRRQKVRVVTEEKPKDIEVYEYRETSHKGSENPKHRKRGQTKTSVYNFRFESDDMNRTSPKQRENIYIRKPKIAHVDGEAYELEDLANDDFFFEQLSKGQHSFESDSESAEEVSPKKSNEDREVILLQIPADQKTEKHRIRKRPKVYIKLAPTKEEDTYDDYGVMDLENASEEMQNSFEKEENIRSENLKVMKRPCGRTNCNPRKLKPKQKPKPIPKQKSKPTLLKLKPKEESVHVTEVVNVAPVHRQKSKHKSFERIVQRSKLNTPDELHDEIDKIFETKDKNYERRGHENSHWELKIVPKRYDDY